MFYFTFILVEINLVGLTPPSKIMETFLDSEFVIINPILFDFVQSFIPQIFVENLWYAKS